FWAAVIRRLTMALSMASPSFIPSRWSTADTHSPAKIRIRSSSSDRKNRLEPGSPCRPARPRSWLSMRRAPCRSVPRMCSPPIPGPPPALLAGLLLGLDVLDGGLPLRLGHVQARGVLVLQLGPGHRLGVAAQDDVGAAAGHVGRDGHGPGPARLGDDLGLAG